MKKLSLVMAAAMCATVGGVYATWNYADEALINYNSKAEKIGVNITTPQFNGAVLSVNVVRNNLGVVIDGSEKEIGGAMTANVASLIANGELQFTFTPASTADIDKVQVTLTVTHVGHGEYDGRSIFTSEAQVSTFISDPIDVTPGETSATTTYTLADIFEETGFGLNGDFVIPTPNAYDKFSAEVNKISEITISIEVTPIYTVATAPLV